MAEKVLVTGAGGFIGSHLVEALVAQGHTVRALVRYDGRGDNGSLAFAPRAVIDAVEIVRGDITDPFFVHAAVQGCQRVYHLAALIAIPYSYLAPKNVFDTNVLGTLNVAQACASLGVGMVHTSTSEVYGTAQSVPITEDHPLTAQSPYAASKIGADQCVLSFVRTYKLRAVVIRPFNTFGPRQSARAVIPTIITQALQGGTVRLGSLHPTRDLLFVQDTVRGFVAAGERLDWLQGQTLQLGTGTEIGIGTLAEKIFALLGKSPSIAVDSARVRPEASEVERLVADASRARAALGWAPSVSLDEGLSRTIAFVRDHIELYRPGEYAR